VSVQDVVALAILGVGIFFILVGALGFVRLPDVFCRLHVTGVLDTLGAPLVLLGAAVHLGATLVSLKLVLGIIFLALTSPLVGHLLARAALEAGHEPGVIDDAERLERVLDKRRRTLNARRAAAAAEVE
jgi:multicomponent Na+:H+ antiporter subunit G